MVTTRAGLRFGASPAIKAIESTKPGCRYLTYRSALLFILTFEHMCMYIDISQPLLVVLLEIVNWIRYFFWKLCPWHSNLYFLGRDSGKISFCRDILESRFWRRIVTLCDSGEGYLVVKPLTTKHSYFIRLLYILDSLTAICFIIPNSTNPPTFSPET